MKVKDLKNILNQISDETEIELFQFVYSGGGDEQTLSDFNLYYSDLSEKLYLAANYIGANFGNDNFLQLNTQGEIWTEEEYPY